MCHGDKTAGTPAPPRATWGNNAPADSTNVRIGAHATHVTGTASSPAFGCQVCHVTPTTPFDAGHGGNGVAPIQFGGLAVNGTTPTWTRATATCSNTYCHNRGGYDGPPVWTRAGLPNGCNSCHGSPPGDDGHWQQEHMGMPCGVCHPSGATLSLPSKALHLDGKVEVIITQNPAYLGQAWTLGFTSCSGCHPGDRM
jgi:predicted CxxxxCH...CXXCH cytochrome family protein